MRLTRSYRIDVADEAGRAISELADAINAGSAGMFGADSSMRRRVSIEQVTFEGAEWLDDPAGRHGSFLDRWYSEKVRGNPEVQRLTKRVYEASENGFGAPECENLRRLFRCAASSRILCLTRVLDSGTERINSRLHRRAAEDAGVSADRSPFILGEPVIVLRNDYDRMLFNGDQGLVLSVRSPGAGATRMAVFPRATISPRFGSTR